MAAFETPPGLPVTLFAKIKAPGQNTGDLQITGNDIKIESSANFVHFEHVYDQQSRAKDICDNDLQRVPPLLVDGYSVCVFVFGAHSSDKSQLLPELARLLLSQTWSALSKSQTPFEVRLSALEIACDTLCDLLQPDNDALALEHTNDGPSVLNQHSAVLSSTNDFSVLLGEAMENRTAQLTEFGPKSAKASLLLCLRITQRRNENDLQCVLRLVELPAADALIYNATQLRMKEGPTLNHELISFASLIDSFSDESVDAPYEASKSNMLLQEALGGNCVTFGVVCLDASSETAINEAVLLYAQRMGAIENYPVVNDRRLRGLLTRYHKRYHSVVRQLETLKESLERQHSDEDDDSAAAKLLSLRTLLVSRERELVALHGDKDKVRESYAQFRRKYSELVESKTALQRELIASEEKCVSVSALLIELQMANNGLKQNESSIRQELESKLIGAENDILETGMREQNLADETARLAKEVEALRSDKKTLSIEYVALRSNYMNLNAELDEANEQQQALNVQLINLINANKALEESDTRLKQDNELLRAKHEELATAHTAAQSESREREQERLRVQTLCDRQAIELVKHEVEMARVRTAMDATKGEYQKKWLKLNKEREVELQSVTAQRTSEAQQNRAQTQQLEREVETLRGQVRVANRQCANAQQQCTEHEEAIGTLSKEAHSLRDALKLQTEDFRAKLLRYLQRVQSSADDHGHGDLGADADAPVSHHVEDLKVTQKKLYEEIVATHNARETDLMREAEMERRRCRALHSQLQAATQKVRSLQDFVKDVAPDAAPPGNLALSMGGDSAAAALGSELEQRWEGQQAKLTALERELAKEKRAHVSTAERAQASSEGIQRELVALKKVLREEHSDCDPMSRQVKSDYQESVGRLKALQHTLETQMEHNAQSQRKMEAMQKTALSMASQQTENERQKARLLEAQVQAMAEEAKRAAEDAKEMKRQLKEAKSSSKSQRRRGSNIGSSDDGDANGAVTGNVAAYQKQIQSVKRKYKESEAKHKRKVAELKGRIAVLEASTNVMNSSLASAGDGNVAWERVAQAEREKAELMAKYNALQAEYKAVEAHYKREIKKYKKLVAKLKRG